MAIEVYYLIYITNNKINNTYLSIRQVVRSFIFWREGDGEHKVKICFSFRICEAERSVGFVPPETRMKTLYILWHLRLILVHHLVQWHNNFFSLMLRERDEPPLRDLSNPTWLGFALRT